MSNEASQMLMDDVYEALDKAEAAGVKLQTMWGVVHHVGLDLEMQMLVTIKEQNAERAELLKAQSAAGDADNKEK